MVDAALPGTGAIAVAVSGGGDSMALLHLLADRAPGRIAAVTVHHHLRAGADAEVVLVAAACAGLGVGHVVLDWWHGGGLQGNVMAAARAARRRLIGGWAEAAGIAEVWLAHTADDLAETLLMRLGRASGVDGLSAMRARWQDGVVWQRPLLAARRGDLRAWLTARGIVWAEDPTNDDPDFDRARARAVLAALAPLGLGVPALADSARHLAEAKAALDAAAAELAGSAVASAGGALRLDVGRLTGAPVELRRRVLRHALAFLSGDPLPPRRAASDRLLAALRRGTLTLGGCRLASDGSTAWLWREARALGTVAPGEIWDGRWRMSGPDDAARIAPLGETGLAAAVTWRAERLPRAVAAASPGVWRGDRLIAAPLAGWPQGWTATPAKHRVTLRDHILSH